MGYSYSVVCKRCGRKLRSEESRNRGYGSYCYRKIAKDEKKDNPALDSTQIEQIEGQMDIDEVVKQVSGV